MYRTIDEIYINVHFIFYEFLCWVHGKFDEMFCILLSRLGFAASPAPSSSWEVAGGMMTETTSCYREM